MYRFVFLFFVVFFGCTPQVEPPACPNTPPQRIISTLPSITEVLFDIELGDRIVGDSFFTEYPPETAKSRKSAINTDSIVKKSLRSNRIWSFCRSKMLPFANRPPLRC